METMTPDQALQILDQATQMVNLPRQAHAQIVEALNVLGRVVEEHQARSGLEVVSDAE